MKTIVCRSYVCRRCVFVVFSFSLGLLAGSVSAQVPRLHPLDGLSTEEYWAVYDILKSNGKVDDDTHFSSVLLHEPPKEEVLAWKQGQSVSRKVDVILSQKEKTFEALVNLSSTSVDSWREARGVFAPIIESELFGILDDLAKHDPRVLAAFSKRGIRDLRTVQCIALPVGYAAFPEQSGRRFAYGNCAEMHGSHHSWGRTIEGLYIMVDLAEKKVLKVVDSGVVPLAPVSVSYEEAPTVPRAGATPIGIVQPLGPSFHIVDGEVTWQNWHFRLRMDPRVGPIVSLVRFDDGKKLRSILYEGSLSEMYVPYMDPANGWATRVFFDAGEFFFGGLTKPLIDGVDCPANAAYFDGVVANEKGMPMLRSHLACLFEQDTGNPAWRHFEDGSGWGRPSRTLVLRAAAVLGNYDYLLDWRFQQDGAIDVAVGATGVVDTKVVANAKVDDSRMDSSATAPSDTYGHMIAPNLVGVDHDHFFSFRLDLDVDGPNNSFMVDRLVRRELPASTFRKSIWVTQSSVAKTEQDAMMDIKLDHPSMWMFVNPAAQGPLGYPTAYEIMPGATAVSLLDAEDLPQKLGAFSDHQLWVTPYRSDERYASGVYPTSSKGEDGLAVWTKANRAIENADIVAWYTLGFHHVPRAEDWPVMPVMWHDFTIRPFDFFPQNPVLTLPAQP